MSFEIEYTPRYWNGAKHLHWRIASDVGATIERFARRGALDAPPGQRVLRGQGDAKAYDVVVLVEPHRSRVVAMYPYRARK